MPPKTPKNARDLWKDETYADWGDWLAGSLFKATLLLALICFAIIFIVLVIAAIGASVGD